MPGVEGYVTLVAPGSKTPWQSTLAALRPAQVFGVGASFAIVGGETLTLGADAAANFLTTFMAADNSAAGMAARINTAAGFTLVTVTAGGQLALTGRVLGVEGQVRVVSGSAGVLGGAGSISGLVVGTTRGGGTDPTKTNLDRGLFSSVAEAERPIENHVGRKLQWSLLSRLDQIQMYQGVSS